MNDKSMTTSPRRSFATERDSLHREGMEAHLQTLARTEPLRHIANFFCKYALRQEVTRFLGRYELFKMVAEVQGCILECGVREGQGLMNWAQISAILEPVAGVLRHVYGFDTFEGFPEVHAKDLDSGVPLNWQPGDVKSESYEDLKRCIELFDLNRLLPQFPKVSLIRGDFRETSEQFVKDNPHVLVSLMYLDFDLYEPTKKALEVFLPRCSKGSIICFDEINHPLWPGETRALLEKFDLRNIAIRKFPWEINMSYIIL